MNYYMMKATLNNLAKNPKVLTATVATVTFLVGLAVGNTTTPTPTPAPTPVDMIYRQNLTVDTCRTDTECHIADALQFYDDYQYPTSIPVIEPVDCSDKQGKAKTNCEQSNKDNAGKPAMYPAICEPYIFGDPTPPEDK